jgi:hypothetical protein
MYNDQETTTQNIYYAPPTPSMDNRRRAIHSRNLQLAHHADGKVAATGRDIEEEIPEIFMSDETVSFHDDRPLSPAWARPQRCNVTQHHGKAGETWRRIERDLNIHSGESE